METEFYTLKEDRTINGYEYKAGEVAMLSTTEAFQNRGVLEKAGGSIKTVGQGSQAMLMSEDDAKEFIDGLEKQIKLGKDVSPSVVTTILRENFGTKVDESTISKWQKRVKTS